MKKKYSLVLKKNCNKEQFKSDLSGISSLEFIPNRECDIIDIVDSRALFTELTDEEVNTLKNDPRVYSIQQTMPLGKLEPAVIFPVQSSGVGPKLQPKFYQNKQNHTNINDTVFNTQALTQQAYVSNLPDGSGVDVVIVDGIISGKSSQTFYSTILFSNTDIHPEFLDSNGNSRVELIDWNTYVNEPSSYPYQSIIENANPSVMDNNIHGTHVAGTACGKTLGWAKNSTIFNISPYNGPLAANEFKFLTAIKNWHLSKTNNRPTVTNHSYAFRLPVFDTRYINKITKDGIEYIAPRETERAIVEVSSITQSGQMESFNIINSGNGYTNRPDISFNGGGGDEATLTMASGTIKEIVITNIGSGYNPSSPPNMLFSSSPAGLTASGVCSVNESGQIDGINMIEWGSGYDNPPSITFDDPISGTTATATTTIGSNFVKSINIINSAPALLRATISLLYDPPSMIISDGGCIKEALWKLSEEGNLIFKNQLIIVDGLYKIATKKTIINETSFKYTLLGGEYNSIPNVSFRYWSSGGLIAGPQARAVINNEGKISEIIPYWILDPSYSVEGAGWFTSIPQVYITNGGGFSEQTLEDFEMVLSTDISSIGLFYPTYIWINNARNIIMDSIIEDLIEANIIVVGAAGNFSWNIKRPGSSGYDTTLEVNYCNNLKDNPSIPYEDNIDNFLQYPTFNLPWGDNIYDTLPLQGSSPTAASGVICVGSMSTSCCPEIKSDFSNTGERIDIYAAGSNIPSALVFNNTDWYHLSNKLYEAADYPTDNRFGIIKLNGTSMASPQVCGAIASYLTEGNVARSENIVEQVRQWISDNGIPALSGLAFPYNLSNGTNKILHFPNITVRY